MSNFINDNIIIDFPLPKIMQNTIKEAEELDKENNTEYYCVADAIDMLAKQYVASGLWNQKQWDLICSKYPIF